VVVELETVVAIDVAAILGVKIAENRSELVWMNSGSEVGNHPSAKSANAVKTLIVQDSRHGRPPVWGVCVTLLRFLEECKPEMSGLFKFLNKPDYFSIFKNRKDNNIK
jgi:hypothetical protein